MGVDVPALRRPHAHPNLRAEKTQYQLQIQFAAGKFKLSSSQQQNSYKNDNKGCSVVPKDSSVVNVHGCHSYCQCTVCQYVTQGCTMGQVAEGLPASSQLGSFIYCGMYAVGSGTPTTDNSGGSTCLAISEI